MIKILYEIYIISFLIWLLLIPIGIYHGYIIGKNEFKKIQYHYDSHLIVILSNGVENYTIFIYCCFYSVIYFGLSLLGGLVLYLFLIFLLIYK